MVHYCYEGGIEGAGGGEKENGSQLRAGPSYTCFAFSAEFQHQSGLKSVQHSARNFSFASI